MKKGSDESNLQGAMMSSKQFRLLTLFLVLNVTFQLISDATARRILWYTLLASILAGVFYQIAVAVPAAPFFDDGPAYKTVFGIIPRVLVGGWLAVFIGDISNNYVLAKLKVLTNGRLLWLRIIASTVVGQLLNTAVFYVVALGGVIPGNALFTGIIAGWAMKTMVETLLMPITYLIVNKVKKFEKVDYYDNDTNFNPFSIAK